MHAAWSSAKVHHAVLWDDTDTPSPHTPPLASGVHRVCAPALVPGVSGTGGAEAHAFPFPRCSVWSREAPAAAPALESSTEHSGVNADTLLLAWRERTNRLLQVVEIERRTALHNHHKNYRGRETHLARTAAPRSDAIHFRSLLYTHTKSSSLCTHT